ncbi:50S ribosomal protein L19-1, chloroplastic-like [Phoenix dactylifera]|uniref:50S ribosomal protein L19-1, chloroplastic-like n=1 Tax=Phoenix dactylifera TaxID=42345 RepID=A0A8B7BVN5_PHODC|nr:50S ribosomal protein L19-1, chloroplastic-like [Phoenix dactylifera]
MGSTALPHPLVSLPKAPPRSPKLALPVFSSLHLCSSTSSRLSTSRAQPRGFGSPVFFPVIRRSREPAVLVAKSSSEEEAAAAGDAEEVAVEEGETLANQSAVEEESKVSDAEAEAKPPRKPRIKLGDIMGILNKRAVEAAEKERPVPDIRTGDIVQIKLEVPENRRRLSIYKGIVMSKQNAGIHTTIRIRRIIAGIGVEIVFPVYSPNIKEIRVVSHRKVRRARLYYLRDKLPRFSTFK